MQLVLLLVITATLPVLVPAYLPRRVYLNVRRTQSVLLVLLLPIGAYLNVRRTRIHVYLVLLLVITATLPVLLPA